ncbi:cupin domain-containing protein [Coleofasciculus sp.]|uniref:cupin domain-containing protein n=1 Tax=Coleofasciculus sp. TaxID=3100458 RepID=UPI003A46988F
MTQENNQLSQSFTLNLPDRIEYPQAGIITKVLFKDQNCQYTLFCLSAGTDISEHTSPRNATVNVLAGKGTLTLEGKEIALAPGVFVLMTANAKHAFKAEENLAFLLTLSENPQTN